MTSEAFDDEPKAPSAFGMWIPGQDLMVRFCDPEATDFTYDDQVKFVAELKALAQRYELAVRDWGPVQGMVAKVLLESDDGDLEIRLRDVEQLLLVLAEGGLIPAAAKPMLQRLTERVQARAR